MARMTRAILLLAIVLAVLAPGRAAAGPPTDQVRGSIDRVLQILTDPELKKEAKTGDRRAAIRTVANEIFDFTEISQRSLARHWAARSPAERQEFVRLFGELLEYSYITKIEAYSGEKIQYTAEVPDGEQAVVKTRIVTKQGVEIPVDYRMFVKDNRWRAYDVNIEGVSLVSNYRTQFNTVIQRSGYGDLVAKLKAKQDERPGQREAGRPVPPSPAPAASPRPGLQTP
jgi:phospholipid transport system substrate-binding protein